MSLIFLDAFQLIGMKFGVALKELKSGILILLLNESSCSIIIGSFELCNKLMWYSFRQL